METLGYRSPDPFGIKGINDENQENCMRHSPIQEVQENLKEPMYYTQGHWRSMAQSPKHAARIVHDVPKQSLAELSLNAVLQRLKVSPDSRKPATGRRVLGEIGTTTPLNSPNHYVMVSPKAARTPISTAPAVASSLSSSSVLAATTTDADVHIATDYVHSCVDAWQKWFAARAYDDLQTGRDVSLKDLEDLHSYRVGLEDLDRALASLPNEDEVIEVQDLIVERLQWLDEVEDELVEELDASQLS